MNQRKLTLLKKTNQKIEKLEIRKRRFQIWQEEIEKKDNEGRASVKELERNLIYWVKEQRLNDRIEYLKTLAFDIERDLFKNKKKEAI